LSILLTLIFQLLQQVEEQEIAVVQELLPVQEQTVHRVSPEIKD
jgi:hypothetical protein